MMKQQALTLSLLFAVALGQAQTFEEAAGSAKSDLDKALAELSALEKKIADEKIPLARELNKLESEVIAKRRAPKVLRLPHDLVRDCVEPT